MVFFEKLTHQCTAILLLLLLRLATTATAPQHSRRRSSSLQQKKQLDLETFSEFPETPGGLSSEFHV